MDSITIKGARVNNLKNIDLDLPRDKFIVFTGLSGSGKSSLAFDTIYAEGQRRYIESLSSYARQFLGQMEKPAIDLIEGLSPAISLNQRTTSNNPRSTVGTVTEVYDYLRLLFARIGTPHCVQCGKEVRKLTIDQIVDGIMALPEGTPIYILSPVVRQRKGEHVKLLHDARRDGFVRVKVDGILHELSEEIKIDKNGRHTIEIVTDRLVIHEGIRQRLTDSVETAATLAGGIINVDIITGEVTKGITYSQSFACPDCDISMEEIEPRMFSFNNPYGACPDCKGLGIQMIFDPHAVVPNPELSLLEGAIKAPGWNFSRDKNSMPLMILRALAKEYSFDLETPYKDLSIETKNIILYGIGEKKLILDLNSGGGMKKSYAYSFEGIIENMKRRHMEASTEQVRQEYEEYMSRVTCPTCNGKRLKPEVLAITVGGLSISDVAFMNLTEAYRFFSTLELTKTQGMIATQVIKEITTRINFLLDVGLNYLSLSRPMSTVSGGEAQRIRLATQIGSGLVGVIYILDEPSIGLHQRDNDKLLYTLRKLRDLGNTLIVVEHDMDTMLASDFIVDIGPYAGTGGGEVIYAGDIKGLMKCESSITGKYLSGALKIETPKVRKPLNGDFLTIKGACENNLKNVDVDLPIGLFTCVTGVSGSGKSSLINEVLYKRMARDLNGAKLIPGEHKDIVGIGNFDKVINIDQSPIGRTPRSNPATYTGLFDLIRDVFAQTVDAKVRGYQKGRFSFNVKGGRCEVCGGDGMLQIEMYFMSDVYVPCEACKGKRYNRETLEVRFKGKSISDVLDMPIGESLEFFMKLPKLMNKLQILNDVGLSYLSLGQSSATLSGGEAQRIKLATELSKRATGRTLYILDEPTTGLHIDDVKKLIEILRKLTATGNTVVVIEHNLDVIKTADYIIDLGPEGGDKGGRLIAYGRPEDICAVSESYTGQYLKKLL